MSQPCPRAPKDEKPAAQRRANTFTFTNARSSVYLSPSTTPHSALPQPYSHSSIPPPPLGLKEFPSYTAPRPPTALLPHYTPWPRPGSAPSSGTSPCQTGSAAQCPGGCYSPARSPPSPPRYPIPSPPQSQYLPAPVPARRSPHPPSSPQSPLLSVALLSSPVFHAAAPAQNNRPSLTLR